MRVSPPTDHGAQQVERVSLAQPNHIAAGQHKLGLDHMVAGETVLEAVRPPEFSATFAAGSCTPAG